MYLMVLEKLKCSIMNGLVYIGRLEKKSGNNSKKLKRLVNSTVIEN